MNGMWKVRCVQSNTLVRAHWAAAEGTPPLFHSYNSHIVTSLEKAQALRQIYWDTVGSDQLYMVPRSTRIRWLSLNKDVIPIQFCNHLHKKPFEGTWLTLVGHWWKWRNLSAKFLVEIYSDNIRLTFLLLLLLNYAK